MSGSKSEITKKEVKHVANLAKLQLTKKEVETFTQQLQDVLSYIDELKEIDTKEVEPTYQVLDGTENILREDKVEDSLSQETVLSQANETYQGYFVAEHVFSQRSKKVKKDILKRKNVDELNAVLTIADEGGSVGHKDLFMTEGVETTAGSNVLNGYNAHYSSTVVKLLENKGFNTKYKLNLDAWGHGASGENSDFGPTLNPWSKKRVAGGSSSGSGAAVASGLVDLATGTDTGGSIRMPASYCNATAIKPGYGNFSRYGVIAFASSLDCPSLMSNTVKDLKKYYDLVSKKDVKDATSMSNKRSKKQTSKVRRIGLPKQFFGDNDKEVEESVKEAIKVFERSGYEVKEVSLPYAKKGVSVYYIIATVETASNLARYDGVRYGNSRANFGDEAKRRIMLGTYSSSAGYADKYYEKAARVRTLIIRDFKNVFEEVDIMLAPVSPILPFKIGEITDDPLKMYLMDIYLTAASLAGVPGLALPCGFSKNGLPIGMQLIGPRWSEEALFEAGEKYQELTDWHSRKPE